MVLASYYQPPGEIVTTVPQRLFTTELFKCDRKFTIRPEVDTSFLWNIREIL